MSDSKEIEVAPNPYGQLAGRRAEIEQAHGSALQMLRETYWAIEKMAESEYADDPQALSFVRIALDDLKQHHRSAVDRVDELIIKAMDGKKREDFGPGIGVVQIDKETRYSEWDHERLLKDVLQGMREQGDMDDPLTMIEALKACTSFNWKGNKREGTGISKYGLEKDEYCKIERGRKKVNFLSKPKAET